MTTHPQADFMRATPESQGIASQAIEAMLRDIRDAAADVHSMLVMRHGRLVFEHYFAPYSATTPHAMFSCSKTFTSMLVGIAQGKGLLSVRDRVLSFFPEKNVAAPSDNLRAMTVEDLLMMGSGNAKDTFPAMYGAMDQPDADFVSIFLNRPVEYRPGTHFVYNTGATYMLSAILTRVTGRTALELANEWLFGPMGIEGATWETCPRGICLGGTGLRITPRDMLKMGMLLLARGRWGDEQLIPADYVDAAQQKHIDNRSGDPGQDPNWAAGYCYQMWRCCFDAYRADGMGGQFIVVKPDLDLIVVFTSALGGDKPIGYPLWLIEHKLLPGVTAQAQDAAPGAEASLAALAESLSAPRPAALPEAAKDFPFGRRLAFSENPLGLSALTVDGNSLRAELPKGALTVEFDWNAPRLNASPKPALGGWARSALVSGEARWRGEKGLLVAARYFGEPLTVHFEISVSGDVVRLRVMNTLAPACEIEGRVV